MSEAEVSENRRRGSGAPAGRWILLAIVLIAGLWFGLQALRNAKPAGAEAPPEAVPQGPPPATVIAAPVVQKPVQERRRVTGTLQAVQRAEVASQETGLVREVHVDVGDEVAEGDLLVSLDDRRMKASLAEARARVTAARAVVAERTAEAERADRDLTMKDELFRQRAVSEREFLDAKRGASVAGARRDSAEEELAAAESALELMMVRTADLQVKAPFSGRVVERHVDPGEWLSPGSAVVTLVSTGTIEAWVHVPERYVAAISGGAENLEIVVDGSGMRVPALAVRRVADVDAVTRLFPVVIEVDDREGSLAPGLSVFAELPVGEAEELPAVPVDAVIETFQGASVFRVSGNPDGGMPIAEKVPVEVRFREDGQVYLDPGPVRPGEQVIVEGNERLFPGTPLILGELPGDGTPDRVDEVKP